jgi:hypothetical protein
VSTPPTQHLRDHATPDAAEHRARRTGRRNRAAGITICVGTAIAAQSAAIISQQQMFSNRAAELFAILTLLTLINLGVAFIIIGGIERITRPIRARQKHLTAEVDGVAHDKAALEEAMQVALAHHSAVLGRLTAVEEVVAPISEQLAAIHERLEEVQKVIDKVPAYGEGVIHGLTLRQDTIGDDD